MNGERCITVESAKWIPGAWNLGNGWFAFRPTPEGHAKPNLCDLSFQELMSMKYDHRGFLVVSQSS